MEWTKIFTDNWEIVSGGVAGIIALAFLFTKMTKTSVDDKAVGLLSSAWKVITGLLGKKKA